MTPSSRSTSAYRVVRMSSKVSLVTVRDIRENGIDDTFEPFN